MKIPPSKANDNSYVGWPAPPPPFSSTVGRGPARGISPEREKGTRAVCCASRIADCPRSTEAGRELGASGRSRISLKKIFSNICFRKIEVGVIMVLMDAIDIDNARTAAVAIGEARPGAYAGYGDGARRGNGAANAFSAGIWYNPLKKLESRKEIHLDFVPKNLEFVPWGLHFVSPDLEFVPTRLDFVPPGLEALPCGLKGRPRPGRLSVPAVARAADHGACGSARRPRAARKWRRKCLKSRKTRPEMAARSSPAAGSGALMRPRRSACARSPRPSPARSAAKA